MCDLFPIYDRPPLLQNAHLFFTPIWDLETRMTMLAQKIKKKRKSKIK